MGAFVPGLGVPPPIGLTPDRTAAWAFTIFCIAMFVLVLVWGMWMLMRRREPMVLALLVGGALCGLVEPIGDIVGLTWYPRTTPLIVYTAWGRHIPSFVPIGEGMFFALAGFGAYQLMLKGASIRAFLLLWVGFSLFDSAMEMFATQEHVWIYYGNNPGRILGLPLYAIVQNGGLAIVTGWVALVAAPYLRGPRWAVLPLAIPCAFLAQAVACTWPAYTALNSRASTAVMWPVIALVTAMNFVLPYLLLKTHIVERRRVWLAGESGDSERLDAAEPPFVAAAL